jgi:phosphoribosylamine--glycine ligase
VFYGGLILTTDGPKVIEFNARFGDPETEVVLPRLKSDIYDLFDAAIDGRDCATEWSQEAMLGVVLASKGYPGSYGKGAEIKGSESVDATIYHMGTAEREGKLVTAGGRVMMVVGRGADLAEAREMAHMAIDQIECEALFHRRDIGHKVLN